MKKTFKICVGYWVNVKTAHSYFHNNYEKVWKKEEFILSSYTLEAAKDEVLQFLAAQNKNSPKINYWECFGITGEARTDTEFTQSFKEFSDKAHLCARNKIYPMFFGTDDIKYDDTQLSGSDLAGQILDTEFAVDRLVKCLGMIFPTQERFRFKKWYDVLDYKNEITITHTNENSNTESEWFKLQRMQCAMFVYGFYDDVNDDFISFTIVDGKGLGRIIKENKLLHTKFKNAKNQLVCAVRLDELRNHGLIMY